MNEPIQSTPPSGTEPPRPKRPWVRIVIIGAAVLAAVLTYVVVTAILNAIEYPADSVVYESTELGYRVEFPGEPVEDSTIQQAGGYELELFVTSWDDGDGAHTVAATAFPAELFSEDRIDQMLTDSLDGAAQSAGATVEKQEFIELGGERAIAGVLTSSGTELRTVIVFHDLVQYQILSVNRSESEHDAFVASFEFLD